MNPNVSVIIPVYNVEKNLRQCLDAVVKQDLKEIEIICIDDGATDSSAKILDEYAASDERFIVVHQENAGAGAARNRGLALARGKYLSFLDADDFFEKEMLSKAYAKAEAENAEVIVFKADFYDDRLGTFFPCNFSLRTGMLPEHRPFAGTDVEKDVFKVIVGWAWDKLFLTSYIRQQKLLFQEQRTTNDAFFVFCAFVKAARITTLDDVLVHQRRNAGGSLSVTREKSWDCFYNALCAMRLQLKKWGLYERFEQDFINYALHFSLWNLNTLKDPTKKRLYNKLRSDWFQNLGITSCSRDKFYNKSEFNQYKNIMDNEYNSTRENIQSSKSRLRTFCRRLLEILGIRK